MRHSPENITLIGEKSLCFQRRLKSFDQLSKIRSCTCRNWNNKTLFGIRKRVQLSVEERWKWFEGERGNLFDRFHQFEIVFGWKSWSWKCSSNERRLREQEKGWARYWLSLWFEGSSSDDWKHWEDLLELLGELQAFETSFPTFKVSQDHKAHQISHSTFSKHLNYFSIHFKTSDNLFLIENKENNNHNKNSIKKKPNCGLQKRNNSTSEPFNRFPLPILLWRALTKL
jgi:hypothetical protein